MGAKRSALLSGVDVKQDRDDDQDQSLHEDEETKHKSAVFVVRILIGDKRAKNYARGQPNHLTFSVPHSAT